MLGMELDYLLREDDMVTLEDDAECGSSVRQRLRKATDVERITCPLARRCYHLAERHTICRSYGLEAYFKSTNLSFESKILINRVSLCLEKS